MHNETLQGSTQVQLHGAAWQDCLQLLDFGPSVPWSIDLASWLGLDPSELHIGIAHWNSAAESTSAGKQQDASSH